MDDREDNGNPRQPSNAHTAAAKEFLKRARSRFEENLVGLSLFGSTVRGETRGLASDVDILVVLRDDADQKAVAEGLHDLAYDVMLEYGPVVELHILSESEFARLQEEGNPFIRRIAAEGRQYA